MYSLFLENKDINIFSWKCLRRSYHSCISIFLCFLFE